MWGRRRVKPSSASDPLVVAAEEIRDVFAGEAATCLRAWVLRSEVCPAQGDSDDQRRREGPGHA
eukprot:12468481-Alexandrium_andersonii.AAC.1